LRDSPPVSPDFLQMPLARPTAFRFNAGMMLEAAIPALCLLWALLCLRFYTLISRDNVWQRRLIAIGAGLGAGLIWLLGSLLLPWLRAPESQPPPAMEAAGDIRIRPTPQR
jgi:hypothetical protein